MPWCKTYLYLRSQPRSRSTLCLKVMKDHLKPKPLVIAERFKFHRRNQHEGEMLPQYLAELLMFSEL